MLILFLCVNNSQTLIFKIRRPLLFLVFLTFSSNKCWWRLRSFSPLETNALAHYLGLFAPLPKGRLRQLAAPLGNVRELGHSVSVQCFYHDFFFFYVPFSLLSFVCPCLYLIFSMLLCLGCVCLSITFKVRSCIGNSNII